MITDSFHAVVFSIVYRKRFAVLQRNADGEKRSMNSRMYSLCKMFPEIEERIVGVDGVHEVEEILDWDSIFASLEMERRSSSKYLRIIKSEQNPSSKK